MESGPESVPTFVMKIASLKVLEQVCFQQPLSLPLSATDWANLLWTSVPWQLEAAIYWRPEKLQKRGIPQKPRSKETYGQTAGKLWRVQRRCLRKRYCVS